MSQEEDLPNSFPIQLNANLLNVDSRWGSWQEFLLAANFNLSRFSLERFWMLQHLLLLCSLYYLPHCVLQYVQDVLLLIRCLLKFRQSAFPIRFYYARVIEFLIEPSFLFKNGHHQVFEESFAYLLFEQCFRRLISRDDLDYYTNLMTKA